MKLVSGEVRGHDVSVSVGPVDSDGRAGGQIIEVLSTNVLPGKCQTLPGRDKQEWLTFLSV